MKERVISYLEAFSDKVETDTLSFREGFMVFLAGAAITLILTWIAGIIGAESTFYLAVLVFALIPFLIVDAE